ncbi:helix-turn-helix transcriptional regulator [Pseudomonas sp. EL_65y_Pfl1_R32]|uniref:helix-turn-helix transcriptional regulator n=1 Tax=Pseudomonas sp. EL_65y_Pfl1_R32 TaxID=3088696 RepID=UPI003519E94F
MFYTINDLVLELRISRATIYRIIKRDGFPAPKKIGKLSRWKCDEVRKYLEGV